VGLPGVSGKKRKRWEMMFHNTTRARRRRGRVFRTLSKRARRREATRLPQPEGQGAAGCCAASAFCKAPFFCKTPFWKVVRLQKTITGFVIVNKSDRHPGGGQKPAERAVRKLLASSTDINLSSRKLLVSST
jgi:hypothetical protein